VGPLEICSQHELANFNMGGALEAAKVVSRDPVVQTKPVGIDSFVEQDAQVKPAVWVKQPSVTHDQGPTYNCTLPSCPSGDTQEPPTHVAIASNATCTKHTSSLNPSEPQPDPLGDVCEESTIVGNSCGVDEVIARVSHLTDDCEWRQADMIWSLQTNPVDIDSFVEQDAQVRPAEGVELPSVNHDQGPTYNRTLLPCPSGDAPEPPPHVVTASDATCMKHARSLNPSEPLADFLDDSCEDSTTAGSSCGVDEIIDGVSHLVDYCERRQADAMLWSVHELGKVPQLPSGDYVIVEPTDQTMPLTLKPMVHRWQSLTTCLGEPAKIEVSQPVRIHSAIDTPSGFCEVAALSHDEYQQSVAWESYDTFGSTYCSWVNNIAFDTPCSVFDKFVW